MGSWLQLRPTSDMLIHQVYDLGTGTLRDLGISQGPNGPL
jgi:hypothetical protein